MGSLRPSPPAPLLPTMSSAAPRQGRARAASIRLPRHFPEAIPQRGRVIVAPPATALPPSSAELQVCRAVGVDMQFTLASDGNTRPHPMRRPSESSGSEWLQERLNIGGIDHEKALRKRCFGDKFAGTAQCVLTPDAGAKTLLVETHSSRKTYADVCLLSFWVEALDLNSFL